MRQTIPYILNKKGNTKQNTKLSQIFLRREERETKKIALEYPALFQNPPLSDLNLIIEGEENNY